MAWLSRAEIERFFTYHAPDADGVRAMQRIRAKARELAELILDVTPASADQSAVVRKLRECVMTANAAIVCKKVDAPEGGRR